MEELWRVAISLTGLSGVGAFVFFSLYKEWITAPVLLDLTKTQKYKLLRLFLILTFSFALVAFGSAAYENYLSTNSVVGSSSELKAITSSRYKYGKRMFEQKMKDPSLTKNQKDELGAIANEYEDHTKNALNALEKNQLNLWHEKSNQIQELLRSDKTKKYIPQNSVNDMAWDPKLEEMIKKQNKKFGPWTI